MWYLIDSAVPQAGVAEALGAAGGAGVAEFEGVVGGAHQAGALRQVAEGGACPALALGAGEGLPQGPIGHREAGLQGTGF